MNPDEEATVTSQVALVEVSTRSFFVVGGTLPRDAPSYIRRKADEELLANLRQGHLSYVLDSRQKGKSSLLARAVEALKAEGVLVVKIDLQRIGANLSPDQWYAAIMRQFGRQLGLDKEVFECWQENFNLGPLARWLAVIEQVVLPRTEAPVVVVVDEVDFVRSLPFSADEFFAGIRECHNRRANDPEFERLTFCLVGSATPSQLVRNIEITPFNVGRRVVLEDFSREELRPFESALGPRGDEIMDRVFSWSGGHPYLTQAISAEVDSDDPAEVDRVVERLFLTIEARQREPNLLDVSRRILEASFEGVAPEESRVQMLTAYRQILKGKRLLIDDSEWRYAALRLCGAVKEDRGTMTVRNRLYQTVFGEKWIQANMPDAEVRRQKRAARNAALRIGVLSLAVLAVIGLLAQRNLALAREQERLKIQAQYDAYCADMIECSVRWDDHDATGLLELLERHENDPWRGWEWDFWKNRLRGTVLRFPDMVEPGYTYSLDGQRLIVRGHNEIRRYTVDGLKLLDRTGIPEGPRWATYELANGDFFDASLGGRLRRFDPSTGETRWEAEVGFMAWPNGHLMDERGRYFLNHCLGQLTLVDLETGTVRRSPRDDYLRPELTRDAEPLVCTYLTDLNEGDTTDRAATPALLDPTDWSVVKRFADIEGGSVITASRRHDLMVCGTNDSEMFFIRISNGRRFHTESFGAGRLWSVALSEDGTLVAGMTIDRKGAIFALDGDNVVKVRDLDGFYGFAFPHRGGTGLAKHHPPMLLSRANLTQGEIVERTTMDHVVDRTPFLTLRSSLDVYKVEVASGKPLLMGARLTDTPLRWRTIAPMPAGLYGIMSVHPMIQVRGEHRLESIVDARTGEVLPWSKHLRSRDLVDACVAPDVRSALANPMVAGSLCRVDFVTGEVRPVAVGANYIQARPSESECITTNAEGQVSIWDLNTYTNRSFRVSRFNINDADLSADHKRLLLGVDPNIGMIVDYRTGEVLRRLRGHSGTVLGVAFSPDGKRCVTGSADRTVRIWDAETGRMLAILRGHTGTVSQVRWLPDGRSIVSADESGLLRRWDGFAPP